MQMLVTIMDMGNTGRGVDLEKINFQPNYFPMVNSHPPFFNTLIRRRKVHIIDKNGFRSACAYVLVSI